MYSEECLHFLPRYLSHIPGLRQIVPGYDSVDFARAWWTPPLSPAAALALERRQLAGLGLNPIVSLTDHDNIEAPMILQVTEARGAVPVSVEWTAPYERSIFHFGIHNLPEEVERSLAAYLAGYTAAPQESELPAMLAALHEIPGVLIVLNHPFWLEEGITAETHRSALDRLLRECLPWIHAFELNGARVWKENEAVFQLAEAYSRPVVSGGDRHTCEPAACINLSNASSFSEFAQEIRDGHSTVLVLPHYGEPMALRILEATWDVLRTYPEYPGRAEWTDRIFYRGEDGVARSVASIWNRRAPKILRAARGLLQFLATSQMRQALRSMLEDRKEILP
jgi:hypothetical protein